MGRGCRYEEEEEEDEDEDEEKEEEEEKDSCFESLRKWHSLNVRELKS